MHITDIVAVGAILLVVGFAVFHIIKAEKHGKKCIGCPDCKSCKHCEK